MSDEEKRGLPTGDVTAAPATPPLLPAMTGLKVLAVLGIFFWHLGIISAPDLGARLCEVFFLVSGFLEGYRHAGSFSDKVGDAVAFVGKKLKAVWPLHLATFLAALVIAIVLGRQWFLGADKKELLLAAVYNLTLTQAWFPAIKFWFNGVSWFLSALMFCYAAVPLLSGAVRRLNSKKGALLVLFAVIVLCRIGLELSSAWCPSLFGTANTHVWPPVRLLEFSAAYLLGYAFIRIGGGFSKRAALDGREATSNGLVLWTAVELVYLAVAICLVVAFNDIWMRWAYVLVFMPGVWLVAEGAGLVSRLLSARPFQLAGRIELPFFMWHQQVIFAYALVRPWLGGGRKLMLAVTLLATVAVSMAWKWAEGRLRRSDRPIRAKSS